MGDVWSTINYPIIFPTKSHKIYFQRIDHLILQGGCRCYPFCFIIKVVTGVNLLARHRVVNNITLNNILFFAKGWSSMLPFSLRIGWLQVLPFSLQIGWSLMLPFSLRIGWSLMLPFYLPDKVVIDVTLLPSG